MLRCNSQLLQLVELAVRLWQRAGELVVVEQTAGGANRAFKSRQRSAGTIPSQQY